MPIEITMPRLSDTMEEGTLIKWRVKVGDKVEAGDVLAEVETDKATMDLTNYEDGVVASMPLKEGEQAPVCELIRADILKGQLPANARLKVADLAKRYGTSTNPVREALQQLRGEGFVLFAPNRGARVRPIDEDFVRDTYEITALIEPHLTAWFVSVVTGEEIDELQSIQEQIETLDFSDEGAHGALDTRFHTLMYDRHYNRHAVDMWRKHRQILSLINVSTGLPISLKRRRQVLEEHRALIAALRAQDVTAAQAAITAHVTGSGEHIVSNMRANRRRQAQVP